MLSLLVRPDNLGGGIVVGTDAGVYADFDLITVGNDDPSPVPPVGHTLGAPYPNPAREHTHIPFTLAEAATVHLAVYDVLGREVAVLTGGPKSVGPHAATWNASGVANGLYLVRLVADGRSFSRPLTVLR